MQPICYTPIGIIRSPFTDPVGTPIQAIGASGFRGTIEIAPDYRAGLRDIEEFSHLTLLYHWHLCAGHALEVRPFLDDRAHGVFATRSPQRPNALGISTVRLVGVDLAAGILTIDDVDVVDGTPLLDIKPYVPVFDQRDVERIGWYAGRVEHVYTTRADERFIAASPRQEDL